MFQKIAKYLSDVRAEFSKVMWPSRGELRESSTIVLMLSFVMAIFTFSIDFIVNRILKLIF